MKDWVLIEIQGKDALNLLNRTCTQLINTETVKTGCASHLLTPKGKILSTFGLIQSPHGNIILEMHQQAYELFKPAIEKFVITEDFSLQEISSFNITSEGIPSALFRSISLHYRLQDTPDRLNENDLTQLRVKNKIPIFPLDYTQEFFAVESDVMQAIHLQKGCYPGQETVAKTVFRGHTPYVLYWVTGNKDAIQTMTQENRGAWISEYLIEDQTYGFVRLPRQSEIQTLSKTYNIRIERHALTADKNPSMVKQL